MYAFWLLLVFLFLWLHIAIFIWAFQSGQFSDQNRARYIPLRQDRMRAPEVAAATGGKRPEAWAMVVIAVIGMAACAAPVVLMIWK